MTESQKPVAFEFHGGSRDGSRVIARFGQPLHDYEVSDADDISVWYFCCEHGRIGAQLPLLTEAAIDLILNETEEEMRAADKHVTSETYEVIERLESKDQVVIRLRHTYT